MPTNPEEIAEILGMKWFASICQEGNPDIHEFYDPQSKQIFTASTLEEATRKIIAITRSGHGTIKRS